MSKGFNKSGNYRNTDKEYQKTRQRQDAREARKDTGNNRKDNRNGKRGKSSEDNAKEFTGGMYVNKHAGQANDSAWYNQLPVLTENATRISWYNQLGSAFPFYANNNEDYRYDGDLNENLPGIMAFRVVTTPGTTIDNKDPMNVASVNLFEYVRKSLNKPNPDYEAQDLTIMLYCIMQLYAQYCNILRAFGITSEWNMNNMYTPQSLLYMAYDWTLEDYNNFIANRANYLSRFNQLIYKASFLFLPTSFKLMDRYAWLFSNVFRDHHRQKAQYYIHKMACTYKFNEKKYDTGSAAEYISFGDGLLKMENMLDTFDDCIEALRTSSSVRIMQSDMRKAFEDKQAWSLAYADDMYQAPIVDSDEVLMQIENATYVDQWDMGFENKDITQSVDDNCLVYNPKYKGINIGEGEQQDQVFPPQIYMNTLPAINCHLDNPTSDDIMVATRQKVGLSERYVGGVLQNVMQVGSDFIVGSEVLLAPLSTDSLLPKLKLRVPGIWSKINGGDYDKVQLYLTRCQAFDWAPMTLLAEVSIADHTLEIAGPTWEWDQYTVIGNDVLNRLHTVAMLSMWYISEFGDWNNI